MYKSVEGRVPLANGGEVYVKADARSCTVTTNREGGVLVFGGKEYPLPIGEFSVEI